MSDAGIIALLAAAYALEQALGLDGSPARD